MNPGHKMMLVILAGAIAAVTSAKAQEPQAVRLRGVIEKVDGNTVMARSDKATNSSSTLLTRLWLSRW